MSIKWVAEIISFVLAAMMKLRLKMTFVMIAKNSAFSLLELIISIAILSIGILVILEGFSFSVQVAGLSSDFINAAILAEDKIQELEFKEKQNPISADTKEVEGKNDKFSWEYNLNLAPDLDPDLKLYKLDFKINWQRAARQETLQFETYLRG